MRLFRSTYILPSTLHNRSAKASQPPVVAMRSMRWYNPSLAKEVKVIRNRRVVDNDIPLCRRQNNR
jgi:hypothetical protein